MLQIVQTAVQSAPLPAPQAPKTRYSLAYEQHVLSHGFDPDAIARFGYMPDQGLDAAGAGVRILELD